MAFQQLKPYCVALIQHVKLSDARNVQALPGLLDALEGCLKSVDPTELGGTSASGLSSAPSSSSSVSQQEQSKRAKSLANYIFFPFSQFLQVNNVKILRSTPSHQAVFANFLRVLSTVIKLCDALDKAVLEQVWTFVGLTLGGPLGSKTFEKSWNDDTRRYLVLLWTAISEREYAITSGGGDTLNLPGPIVAHTLNTILLLLEEKDTEQDTRLAALSFLNAFIRHHLEKEDKVPIYLPGIVSTMSKIIHAHRNNGKIVAEAMKPLSSAVKASLDENRCEALDLYDDQESQDEVRPTSLEAIFAQQDKVKELVKVPNLQGPFGGSLPTHDPSIDPASKGNSTSKSSSSSEAGMSKAWLKGTSSQLQRAIFSIIPILRNHQNAEVRMALASFASIQLEYCYKSLTPPTSRLLLEELLVCSRDTWEQVSTPAQEAVKRLLGSSIPSDQFVPTQPPIRKLLVEIGREAITSLPHSIFTNGLAHENTLQRQLNLIIAIQNCGIDLTARQLKVERWSLNLLRALEFAPIVSSGNAGPRDETTAWLRSSSSSLLLLDNADRPARPLIEPGVDSQRNEQDDGAKSKLPSFPTLTLANVAPGLSTMLLEEAIRSLHSISGCSEIVQHFLALAGYADTGLPLGGISTVASALWVVQQLLEGTAQSQTKLSKTSPQENDNFQNLRRTVKEVPDLVLSWLNREDLEEMEFFSRAEETGAPPDAMQEDVKEDEDMEATEIQTAGSISLAGLLDADSSKAIAKSSKRSAPRPSFEIQVHCMSLRLLSISSAILRTEFQPFMMHVLYPLLRTLSPSSESRVGVLQAHAYCALHHISAHLGYDGPSSMLVNNVDYILNSVSAHLRGTTTLSDGALDPLAPSVLVSVIELAGEDILPHLGDAVDEIFDALDRWHAYDLLVSELLRVLDRLVNICKVDEAKIAPLRIQEGRAIAEVQKMKPDPEKDLLAFEEWFMTRHHDRLRFKSETEDEKPPKKDNLPESNPEQPFQRLTKTDEEKEEDNEEDEDDPAMPLEGEKEEDKEPPLTKSQALVLSILRKALYFLSHSSAFLRARVLALITSSIPLLADRSGDFLPEINRFWPYILARLDDGFEKSPAFVLFEVMRLLVALMKYRGDFMNRRIWKDVMPRLRHIVSSQKLHFTVKNQYTNEYRTMREVMQLVTVALRDVPGVSGDDLWTVAVLFRPFLSKSVDPKLRSEANSLYQAIGQLDPDLVWLVLSSGLGRITDLSALRVESWSDTEPEVAYILESV